MVAGLGGPTSKTGTQWGLNQEKKVSLVTLPTWFFSWGDSSRFARVAPCPKICETKRTLAKTSVSIENHKGKCNYAKEK
jgi:hypothetical protein